MYERRGEVLLEMRGVSFVWRAGTGGCTASARALRGADLRVRAGEVVAVAGAAGAGKTTLLLCAAGLLPLDAGVRVAASRTAFVDGTGAWAMDVMAQVERGARVLLLDVLDPPALASPRAVAALAGSLAASGLAVVVAARDASALPAFATRLVTLAAGRVVGCEAPLEAVLGTRRVGMQRRRDDIVGATAARMVRGFVAAGAGTP